MPENDRSKYIWKLVYSVNQLHIELAGLYRAKSDDRKRINLLWNAIEDQESQLFLEGVNVY